MSQGAPEGNGLELEVGPDSSFSPPRDMRDEVLEHGECAPVGTVRGWKHLLEQRATGQGAGDVRVSFPPHLTAELTVADRRQKREIRQLEQELHKWQVLVDSITGEEAGPGGLGFSSPRRAEPPRLFPSPLTPFPQWISPWLPAWKALRSGLFSNTSCPPLGMSSPDFDNQTLAVLRGRMVRYLMRSREVRPGLSSHPRPPLPRLPPPSVCPSLAFLCLILPWPAWTPPSAQPSGPSPHLPPFPRSPWAEQPRTTRLTWTCLWRAQPGRSPGSKVPAGSSGRLSPGLSLPSSPRAWSLGTPGIGCG